jgi:O-acetyl-ADP-ribose deacetylase (regulator of RNase III)
MYRNICLKKRTRTYAVEQDHEAYLEASISGVENIALAAITTDVSDFPPDRGNFNEEKLTTSRKQSLN